MMPSGRQSSTKKGERFFSDVETRKFSLFERHTVSGSTAPGRFCFLPLAFRDRWSRAGTGVLFLTASTRAQLG